MQYRFQEEIEAGELVETLAVQMLPLFSFEDQHKLQGPCLLWDWRPDLIDELLACLTPPATRVDLLSSSFGQAGSMDSAQQQEEKPSATTNGHKPEQQQEAAGRPSGPYETEPRFGTHFWRERLPASLLERWSSVSLHAAVSLPEPNPFVASDFTVKPLPPPPPASGSVLGPECEAVLDELGGRFSDLQPVSDILKATPLTVLPDQLLSEPGLQLWHLQDRHFNMPRTAVFLKLATPLAYYTARHEALTELLNRLVKDSLNQTTYLASLAELHYHSKATELGLELHVHGLSHRLLTLLQLVLSRLLRFVKDGHLDQTRFDTQKEALLRHYRNEDMKTSRHARNLRLAVLKERHWSAQELEREGASITLHELQQFVPQLLARLHVDCFMHGNCDRQDADQLAALVRATLKDAGVVPLPPEDYPGNRVVRLPEGKTLVLRLPSVDVGERNSSVEAYWQVGQDDVPARVQVQLLEHVMEEPLYDTLRTRWQLGYSVSCGLRMTNGVLGLCIRVMSERFDPATLQARIDEFLVRFRERVTGMSEHQWAKHLLALVQLKLQRDASYHDEGERYWAEILERRHQFDVARLEAQALLLGASKERMLGLLQSCVSPDAGTARQLCVQVVGQASRPARKAAGVGSPLTRSPQRAHKGGQHEAEDGPPSPARSPSKAVRAAREVVTLAQPADLLLLQTDDQPVDFFPNLI